MTTKMNYTWDIIKDGLTQTQILRFIECKRKFYYALIRGWSQEYYSDSMWFGIVFHDCLELWYEGVEENPDEILQHVIAKYEEKEGVDQWPLQNRQDWNFLTAQLYAVFPAYCEYYEDTDANIVWESLEEVFKVPLRIRLGDGKVITVPINGKTDGKCRTKPRNRVIFETKTKGRMNVGGIKNTLEKDFQVNLYAWAANETREGKDRYNTVLYNLIKRPALRQTQKETLPQHTVRLQKELSTKGSEYFVRLTVPIKAKQQELFVKSLRKIVTEIAEFVLYDKGGSDDQFSPACLGPYGQCQYLGVCYHGDTKGLKRRTVAFPELQED